MEDLISLVNLTTKQKIRQIEIVGRKTSATQGKLDKLFAGIANGRFLNDDSALEELYGPDPSETTRAAYQKLKLRLQKRLYNTVFFISPNEARYKKTQTAYYYCFKQLAAVKILIGKGARKAAIPLAEKTLRKAMKFEITQVAMELAADLRIHYAVNGGTEAQCRYYDKIVEDYSELRHAEQEAEKYYALLMVKATRKRSTDPVLYQEAKEYSEKLKKTFKQLNVKSFRFSQLYFMVRILQHEIQGDSRKTIEVCDEAIEYFGKNKRGAHNTIQFTFAFKKLQAFIQAKQYEAARQAATDCEQLLDKQKAYSDWLHVQYCRILLCFRTGEYKEAFDIYHQAKSNKEQFNRQYQVAQERWTLINAYLQFLISIGKITPPEPQKFQKFRIGRMLNELPIFSKDKFGYNIDLIALNVLFSLHRKRFNIIIDKMESWKTYIYRLQQKKRPKNRGLYFLHMLLCLPSANFHPVAVERHAADWLKKLRNAQMDTEMEIIPYETLWEFIHDLLSQ
ncbi:hypothetical protein [Flavilitoribacter nigricans]|uniref:Tetratricopeptide repeat protein n=1 Tax=Flavilitoribacter nigricans (strain ATCC 23147 / DSM 23189 / NBRC 102662 / NCIMB 1420 / SS-2) TaxID=1122177 RepID=A0A2D0N6R8_FLAN2|nr:hypothetical protein [Flavilitoribacter nigricans]PHN04080.1 hypothetical protein CRP01_23060 [Flavilitoribacter nigricans DSM 23189 = NBRC 102662]